MNQYVVFCVISVTCFTASAQYFDIISNYLYQHTNNVNSMMRPHPSDLYLMHDKYGYIQALQQKEKVEIKLYYECLCPDCILFDTKHFIPTVKKLGEYLDIHVYPYGNARTINQNGKVEVICQHGPDECYGNKLHACSIDTLDDLTTALYFNGCMMEPNQTRRGSDDAAADRCGKRMNIDPEPIKSCAKGPRGLVLLLIYGEESKKAGFKEVPYILINGVQNDGNNFMYDVCASFINPPIECNEILTA